MPKPKPPYAAEFRQQIVELVAAGRSTSELAREFGCHETTIRSWVRLSGGSKAVAAKTTPALNDAERQELIELRRKLRQVQMERDILAKATAWFARNGE
jgi:transposase